MDGVRVLVVRGDLHVKHESIDELGAVLFCAFPEKIIKNLATKHSNVFEWLQSTADIHFAIRGRDHLHFCDLPVNDGFRQIEFGNHAQRDGAAARLAVVHFTLEEEGFNSVLGKSFSGTGASRAASNDCNAQRCLDGEGKLKVAALGFERDNMSSAEERFFRGNFFSEDGSVLLLLATRYGAEGYRALCDRDSSIQDECHGCSPKRNERSDGAAEVLKARNLVD
mmetsp:Transcript_21165/g.36347  ORF Transcript_21165/g.36347 Transcript_21165/m.36347 type:complete len:224 (-) Transcript_21165:40-711(-)